MPEIETCNLEELRCRKARQESGEKLGGRQARLGVWSPDSTGKPGLEFGVLIVPESRLGVWSPDSTGKQVWSLES